MEQKSLDETPQVQLGKASSMLSQDHLRAHVMETFGDEAKASHWLNRPNPLFAGKTPLELLDTDPQAIEIELTRIDHGIFV